LILIDQINNHSINHRLWCWGIGILSLLCTTVTLENWSFVIRITAMSTTMCICDSEWWSSQPKYHVLLHQFSFFDIDNGISCLRVVVIICSYHDYVPILWCPWFYFLFFCDVVFRHGVNCHTYCTHIQWWICPSASSYKKDNTQANHRVIKLINVLYHRIIIIYDNWIRFLFLLCSVCVCVCVPVCAVKLGRSTLNTCGCKWTNVCAIQFSTCTFLFIMPLVVFFAWIRWLFHCNDQLLNFISMCTCHTTIWIMDLYYTYCCFTF